MARKEGKGGLKHRMLQRFLADYFRKQGKPAIIEAFIGKNVDILVNDINKTIAIEIQLTPKHCEQVKKDYEFGCDKVWVICESIRILENIKSKLRYELNKALFKKTEFYLIKEFLPHKKNKNTRIRRNKITEENSGIKKERRRQKIYLTFTQAH